MGGNLVSVARYPASDPVTERPYDIDIDPNTNTSTDGACPTPCLSGTMDARHCLAGASRRVVGPGSRRQPREGWCGVLNDGSPTVPLPTHAPPPLCPHPHPHPHTLLAGPPNLHPPARPRRRTALHSNPAFFTPTPPSSVWPGRRSASWNGGKYLTLPHSPLQ